jgi:hypothetical protein
MTRVTRVYHLRSPFETLFVLNINASNGLINRMGPARVARRLPHRGCRSDTEARAMPKSARIPAATLPWYIGGPFHEPDRLCESFPPPHQEKKTAGDTRHKRGHPFPPVLREAHSPADPGQQEERRDQKPSKDFDRTVSGRRPVVMESDNRRTAGHQHCHGDLAESHGCLLSNLVGRGVPTMPIDRERMAGRAHPTSGAECSLPGV